MITETKHEHVKHITSCHYEATLQ